MLYPVRAKVSYLREPLREEVSRLREPLRGEVSRLREPLRGEASCPRELPRLKESEMTSREYPWYRPLAAISPSFGCLSG